VKVIAQASRLRLERHNDEGRAVFLLIVPKITQQFSFPRSGLALKTRRVGWKSVR